MNAVINSPEELEVRLALRTELFHLGILVKLDHLKSLKNDDLNVQIEIFDHESGGDLSEFQADQAASLDLMSDQAIFHQIKNNLSDEESSKWFLKVLQHMLLMPRDRYRR